MLKPKMTLCVMMLPLVVVGCTSKQSVSQCVKPPRLPAWIMQLSDQTPLNGIISPSERGLIIKNNEGTRSILMSRDRVAHIDGNHAIIAIIHTRPCFGWQMPATTEQSIYECLLGFCFNNIFCATTNFGCIDSFLLPNSRNEEMMGDGFFGAAVAGLF